MLVVFHQSALQHRDILFLKRGAAMMLLLSQDVSSHLFETRCTDSEGSIAFLPGKAVQPKLPMNPSRGLALELTHHIGQAMGGAQSGKHVNMISRTAHGVRDAIQAAHSSTEVLVHTGPRTGREPRLARFCAKDEMIMQRGMG